MVTLAEIKGYINGNERGVYTPAPTLKTWAEIQAYTDASALLTELNTYPTEYYNMIDGESDIDIVYDPCEYGSNNSYIVNVSRGSFQKIANKVRYYDNSNLIWYYTNSNPCPL